MTKIVHYLGLERQELAQVPIELRLVYEAGPCGFVLCRHLRNRGYCLAR